MPRRRSTSPGEVFLSHATGDRSVATRIATVLRAHGVPVWYSATDILGAQRWHDEIGGALARCAWFAVLLSPHAVRSRWVRHEVLYAVNQSRFDNRILPLLLKPCDADLLSWILPSYQWVDFTGSFDEGCRKLLQVWDRGFTGRRA